MEAIEELQLGQRGSVDYLGIALSQTDAVGHRFGPFSREQLDNLLRLDLQLDRLFSRLDDAVGPGRWVMVVSADHGVLAIPEHLAEAGVDARRQTRAERAEVRAVIQSALDGLSAGQSPEEAVKSAVSALPGVAAAYTFSEIESGVASDSFQVLFAHSHSRTRSVGPAAPVGVYLRYGRNVLTSSTSRASHSTSYYYDRHVPMIFLGGTIQPGVSEDRVATVDVAPTLAWLVGAPAPDDLDGRVLEGVLGR